MHRGKRTCNTVSTLRHLPILVLKGFDDQDNEIGLSANSAILMGTDGDAFCRAGLVCI